MLPSWCAESVTVERAPLVASRGTQVRDWASAVPHVVEGCSLQVTSMAGTIADRENAEGGATLYAPPGADIAQGDRIEADGQTWHVRGRPYAVRSPFGSVSHVVAQLDEWEG